MAIALQQKFFRFGYDDGTEATHTFRALENVNVTIPVDTNFLLRFCVQEAGGTAAANLVQQFQYNRNAAGWVNITTATTIVKAVAVAAFTNGQNCTKRLSGTGTFETTAAGCTEDGNSGGNTNDVAASGNTETEAGLVIVGANVNNNDSIQIRLTVSGPTTTITYTVTPTITVSKSVSVNVTVPNAGTSTADAVSPTVAGGANIDAVNSTAVANAISPEVTGESGLNANIDATLGTSTAEFINPTLQAGANVTAIVSDTSALFEDPTIQAGASILSVPGTAIAELINPEITGATSTEIIVNNPGLAEASFSGVAVSSGANIISVSGLVSSEFINPDISAAAGIDASTGISNAESPVPQVTGGDGSTVNANIEALPGLAFAEAVSPFSIIGNAVVEENEQIPEVPLFPAPMILASSAEAATVSISPGSSGKTYGLAVPMDETLIFLMFAVLESEA